MKVYFDNAATTPLSPEVLQRMLPYLTEHYGNPSSTHQFGRKAKAAIETARKDIAALLKCSPMEICFTSGGTEADNLALHGAVHQLGVKRIISTEAEHHAVLHTLEHLNKDAVELRLLSLDGHGRIAVDELEQLLAASSDKTLVSLMHANNETGTMINLEAVASCCHRHGALFHSDTVQTMGHYPMDLSATPVHFITAAAHKFHGPKGTGFLYFRKNTKLAPLIFGGSQERNLRAGTENIYGIVGMAEALKLAYAEMDAHREQVSEIKAYMKARLSEALPGVQVNGCEDNSLYTVLNVKLPPTDKASMLLFLLDMDGIACSGGSACSSGSNQGSHVLRGMGVDQNSPSIRFSFSRYNTREEVDYVVEKLKVHLSEAVQA